MMALRLLLVINVSVLVDGRSDWSIVHIRAISRVRYVNRCRVIREVFDYRRKSLNNVNLITMFVISNQSGAGIHFMIK